MKHYDDIDYDQFLYPEPRLPTGAPLDLSARLGNRQTSDG